MKKILGIILAILFVIVFVGGLVVIKTSEGYEILEVFISLGIAFGIAAIMLVWVWVIIHLLVD